MQPRIIVPLVLALVNLCHDVVVFSLSSSEFKYNLDEGYPLEPGIIGNIAGIDLDKNNNVIIFHRGSHKWLADTFDMKGVYLPTAAGPIKEDTVITIDPTGKQVIRTWGSNLFYMPHGLSLNPEETSVWLTDVALHQVYKYSIDGTEEQLVLGTAFEPGNDDTHFCKPTSVADTGDYVFVADGYCNSRIIMFSPSGKYIGEFGQSGYPGSYLPSSSSSSVQPVFNIPHKLTYAKEANMLCVADRENGRIQCFSFEPRGARRGHGLILGNAIKPKFTIADPLFNGKVFSIDYSPIRGGILVAVSGRPFDSSEPAPQGFVYNITTGQLLSRFSPPVPKQFGMSHDLAITSDDAKSIYVVDIEPINLWKFSRQIRKREGRAGEHFSQAISLMQNREARSNVFFYGALIVVVAIILYLLSKLSSITRRSIPANSFASLYSSSYPNSVNGLFSNGRLSSRQVGGRAHAFMSSMFSRGTFLNMFNIRRQQQSDFSRIPLEESDNSDEDKSDSDVEEFNINQANTNIKIDV